MSKVIEISNCKHCKYNLIRKPCPIPVKDIIKNDWDNIHPDCPLKDKPEFPSEEESNSECFRRNNKPEGYRNKHNYPQGFIIGWKMCYNWLKSKGGK